MEDLILDIENNSEICEVCEKKFIPRASYQRIEKNEKIYFVCSISCKNKLLNKSYENKKCIVCSKMFLKQYSYQSLKIGDSNLYFCSIDCKNKISKAVTGQKKEEKKKTRIIAIFTQKGGTGKTTTAVNLAIGLKQRNYKTLLIDGDPQGSIEDSLDIIEPHKTLYDVFKDTPIKDVILETDRYPDLILSDSSLNVINVELAKNKNRHGVLKEKIGDFLNKYDYVIIDCSPTLSITNQNILYLAKEILIPISCDYLSLASLGQVLATINDIEKFLNHKLFLLGILPTFYIKNQKSSKEIYAALKKYNLPKIFSPIPETADIRFSASIKESIVTMKGKKGETSYNELVNRVIKTIPQY